MCAQLMWLKEDQYEQLDEETIRNADRRFASSSYHKAKTPPALKWATDRFAGF